jgi:hypothetical protein
VVRKHVLDNGGEVWLIGWPSLDANDCNWAKSLSAEEYLAELEKRKRKKRKK